MLLDILDAPVCKTIRMNLLQQQADHHTLEGMGMLTLATMIHALTVLRIRSTADPQLYGE